MPTLKTPVGRAKSIAAASFENIDVHVHVPAGAIPKDGPSAGLAMFIALAAQRAGVRTVLLPRRNEKDLRDVPESTRQALTFVWRDNVDDAIRAPLLLLGKPA